MNSSTHVVSVFPDGPGGGNPAPLVLDADGMSDQEMQAFAGSHGYECGFVLSAPPASECDFGMRFWVPTGEMSMCGHATVGATWLLDRLGALAGDDLRISTPSGVVLARVRDGAGGTREVTITQPAGRIETPTRAAVGELLDVLGIAESALADSPVVNAATSRAKTLVPLRDTRILDGLDPDFSRMRELCDHLGSTGLYPYAYPDPADPLLVDARQFPQSAGYPEDAATGVGAAALAFGLLLGGAPPLSAGATLRVRQGRAMGRPSLITVRFRETAGVVDGCWLGGAVELLDS